MNCLIRTGPLLVAGEPDKTKHKGWSYSWPITGVPFSRWHKVIHGQEFIAFVQKENNASNVYGFYRGPLFNRDGRN